MPEMAAEDFRRRLDAFMAADPWPGTPAERERERDALNELAQTQAYTNWLDAYHRHEPMTLDDAPPTTR